MEHGILGTYPPLVTARTVDRILTDDQQKIPRKVFLTCPPSQGKNCSLRSE